MAFSRDISQLTSEIVALTATLSVTGTIHASHHPMPRNPDNSSTARDREMRLQRIGDAARDFGGVLSCGYGLLEDHGSWFRAFKGTLQAGISDPALCTYEDELRCRLARATRLVEAFPSKVLGNDEDGDCEMLVEKADSDEMETSLDEGVPLGEEAQRNFGLSAPEDLCKQLQRLKLQCDQQIKERDESLLQCTQIIQRLEDECARLQKELAFQNEELRVLVRERDMLKAKAGPHW